MENDCEMSITTVNQRPVCRGELIFEDTFDSINLNKWRHQIKISLDTEAIIIVYILHQVKVYYKAHICFLPI